MKVKMNAVNAFLKGSVTALLMMVSVAVSAQNLTTVKGTVTDAEGQPVIGATVKVQGSTQAVITDIDGNYTLQCAPGSTLQFSYVGSRTQTIKLGNRTSLNVKLQDDALSMDEVVVTALNIKRQSRSLGYSTTKVDGKDFTMARDPNIGNALAGKVAGLNITTNFLTFLEDFY